MPGHALSMLLSPVPAYTHSSNPISLRPYHFFLWLIVSDLMYIMNAAMVENQSLIYTELPWPLLTLDLTQERLLEDWVVELLVEASRGSSAGGHCIQVPQPMLVCCRIYVSYGSFAMSRELSSSRHHLRCFFHSSEARKHYSCHNTLCIQTSRAIMSF